MAQRHGAQQHNGTQPNAPLGLPWPFWIATLIAFINAVSFTIIIPTLYPFAKLLDLSDLQASLLTTSYAAAQFLATPILGRLSDRLGRRPLLLISLLGTVVANLIAGYAAVAWLLFCARILDGLTGGNTSIALATISDVTSPEQRPKAFGVFGATFRLGFIVGPALSYLAQQLPTLPGVSHLGMSFMVSAIVAAIAVLLTFFFLAESHRPQKTKADSNQSTAQDSRRAQLSFASLWADLGLGKVIRSIRHPKFGRLFLLTFLSGSTFTIFAFAFQPFFINVLDQDAKSLAIAFALVGLLGFIAQIFGLDPLRRRFTVVSILSATLVARGIAFLLMPVVPGLTAFLLLLAVFGAVNSFPAPLIDSMLSLRSDRQQQGEVLGLNASYLSISNAIGPAIGGLLVSLGYRMPFWITGVLTILTGLFALTLRQNDRNNQPQRN